jgi:hypothetical protein
MIVGNVEEIFQDANAKILDIRLKSEGILTRVCRIILKVLSVGVRFGVCDLWPQVVSVIVVRVSCEC